MLPQNQIAGGVPGPSRATPSPQRQSSWSLDSFDILSLLDRGYSAKVVLAKSKETQELYAAKIFAKTLLVDNSEVDSTLAEKNILQLATENDHPFIARFYASTHTPTFVVFFMEHCPGGSLLLQLQRASQRFSVDTARFYAAEFCLVLKWLHEQGVIYRNVKLENILLGLDGHIRVVDFGICKTAIQKGEHTRSFVGTTEFMAPELLLDKPYGHDIDWWSFGVLIYALVTRQVPFQGEDEDEIYDAILVGKPGFPPPMTPQTISVISQLLEPTPRLGSGPGGAEDVMRHEWFEGIDWHELYCKRIPPPLLPTVSSATDTQNFDSEFTSQAVSATPDSATQDTKVLSEEAQEQFQTFDFSFENQ